MTAATLPIASNKKLWWISWHQMADPKGGLDCRPIVWPPPVPVLAFWESGFAADESYVTVVALVAAPTEEDAAAVITEAWSPGVGEFRFNREHDPSERTGDRFTAPKWSISLKRWPWAVG